MKNVDKVLNELIRIQAKLSRFEDDLLNVEFITDDEEDQQELIDALHSAQEIQEKLFQDTLAELINLDKMSDKFLYPVLDTDDQERIWDWQFDEIEKFAKNYGEE